MPKPPQKKDALVKWKERLANAAASATKVVAQVGGGGNFISLKSGVLSYQKAIIPENKMRVIVLAQLLENQYYDQPFEEGSPASPACYAYGTTDRKTMKPDPEQVEHPVSDKCDGCENKEFGTADRGKGKACADVMRLAMITEGDLGELETAEIAYMKIPYFTTLEWAGYVRQLSDVHHISPVGGTDADGAVPPGFITQLEVVPDKKSQFRVKFKMVEKIEFDEKSFTELAARTAEALKSIAFPYPRFDTVKEQPKKGKARR